jgi:hypothetical protein
MNFKENKKQGGEEKENIHLDRESKRHNNHSEEPFLIREEKTRHKEQEEMKHGEIERKH